MLYLNKIDCYFLFYFMGVETKYIMAMFIEKNDNTMEKVDMTKEHKETLNIKKDITFIFDNPRGVLIMTKNITELNQQIKKQERIIANYDKHIELLSKNPTKNAIEIKKSETQKNGCKYFIKIIKLDIMLYTYYIERKDITKMVELFKIKYQKLYSELFEHSEELVEVGSINEGEHLQNAKYTKEDYERSIKHIDYYIDATFIMITNKRVKVHN